MRLKFVLVRKANRVSRKTMRGSIFELKHSVEIRRWNLIQCVSVDQVSVVLLVVERKQIVAFFHFTMKRSALISKLSLETQLTKIAFSALLVRFFG
jgi:hypothetical protein